MKSLSYEGAIAVSVRVFSLRVLSVVTWLWLTAAGPVMAEDGAILLTVAGAAPAVTGVDYGITIAGEIVTPSEAGPQRFPLKSQGEFRFRQHAFRNESRSVSALRAIRDFQAASTATTVGADHTTKVALSAAYRRVFVTGSDNGLLLWSPRYALPRQQLDLLQMPFDALAVEALLPGTAVRIGDKWNADAGLIAALTGLEVAVEQSATCELMSATASEAIVSVTGTIKGAVQGSASDVSFDAKLTFDRVTGMVAEFQGTQKEQRSPGPVSPGLDVTATLHWKQTLAEDTDPAVDEPPAGLPAESQLQLALQTPLKLQLRHSREWYLFHETSSVLMIRQLREGNMISQCNISAAVTVPPKQHTPDREFLADVTESVRERRGRVVDQQTVRDDDRWRIRHVRAEGVAAGKDIVWDYYLCAAVTGEQFSIVFSYAKEDNDQFAGEATRLLDTLQIARRRPALPFR